MDRFVNSTMVEPSFSTVDDFSNFTLKLASNRTFSRWMINRLRIFLYISNPYEEMFESEAEVADYHEEVSFH